MAGEVLTLDEKRKAEAVGEARRALRLAILALEAAKHRLVEADRALPGADEI
jgi:hypothetical protein